MSPLKDSSNKGFSTRLIKVDGSNGFGFGVTRFVQCPVGRAIKSLNGFSQRRSEGG